MKPKVIAVTGKIGSGKSTVCNYLRGKGYFVVDCDVLARQISDDEQVVAEVKNLLGETYVTNGKIDRKAVRNVIFHQPKLLAAYNNLFFDRVKQRLQQVVDERDEQVVFVEIAVLDAFPFDWTEVWLVQASDGNRTSRVTARDGVTDADVARISANQKDCGSAVAIFNDGTLEQLYADVDKQLMRLQIVDKTADKV